MRFVLTKNHDPALILEAPSEPDAGLWALRHGYDRFPRSQESIDAGHTALIEALTHKFITEGAPAEEAARRAALGAGSAPSELLAARLRLVEVPRQEPDARFFDNRANAAKAGESKRNIDEGTAEHWSGEIMEPARPARVPRS